MRVITAGPCVSEFGWELMEYVGYIMRQAEQADLVYVCSRPDREPLYAPLGDKLRFIPHGIKGIVTDHRPHEIYNPDEMDRVKAELARITKEHRDRGDQIFEVTIPSPPARFKEKFADTGRQVLPRYGTKFPRVLVHMRDKKFVKNSQRNYPPELWKEIVESLRCKYGQVGAIGTTDEALCFAGMIDLRGLPLDRLFDAIATADLVVGPSSGPIHLASLCGTPHVVWVEKGITRTRYETAWNPHKTRCAILDDDGKGSTFIAPESVMKAVGEVMQPAKVERTGCGVLYVCVGASYAKLLENSLTTLRRHYSGPVAILCDNDAHISEMAAANNAQVITVSTPAGHEHYRSRHIKTSIHKHTPFATTLYIDCDTFILQPIDDVWSELPADRAISMRTEGVCPTLADRSWVNCPEEAEFTLELCGRTAWHWHSSTILFTQSKEVDDLFSEWHRQWKNLADAFPENRVQDQGALARACAICKPQIQLLPARYNARCVKGQGDHIADETVIYSPGIRAGDYSAESQGIMRKYFDAETNYVPKATFLATSREHLSSVKQVGKKNRCPHCGGKVISKIQRRYGVRP